MRFRLTFAHRHSHADIRIFYVDELPPYVCASTVTDRKRFAERMANKIRNAYVRPHFETFIVCVPRRNAS